MLKKNRKLCELCRFSLRGSHLKCLEKMIVYTLMAEQTVVQYE